MFYVHRSNRAENLVAMLADIVGRDPAGPFEAEPIVVQGRGMERWLSMELARRFGVWANPRFPFPRKFLLDLFALNLDADPVTLARFEPEALTWAIAARLPELLGRPELTVLERYLREGDSGGDVGRLLSLAGKIAGTFDDYVVFRSDLIAGWERKCDGSWESILWRRLVEDLGPNHIAARARELLAQSNVRAPALVLPPRITLFGISTLAPLYLQIFTELAAHAEVHLFVLSPSDQYWADIRGRREVVAELFQRTAADESELDQALEREVGNRLLASLGRIGREFQAVLEGTADYHGEEKYEDPLAAGGESMLAQVQSDMMHLAYRSAGGTTEPVRGPAEDRSLLVSSCHGPMREVQVLHDQMRAMFAADETLQPRDVIVMTPDIDVYAPFIDAVFGADDTRGIPYRIADRGPRATSEVFEALRELLQVLPGRMTSAEVVDLLRFAIIRRRFGFDEADIEVVREWIDRCEVRWGIDAAHRSLHGHPPVEQNTWEFGLRRLILGYAVGDDDTGERPYAPYDDLEGGDAAILGRLAELCQHLFAAARRFAVPFAVGDWPGAVAQLIDGSFAQDGAAAFQAQALRAAVEAIAARALEAGFGGVVDIATMLKLIEDELRLKTLAQGFLTGDVTFCELVPMRTIPFRVVCLIGMNDGNFPRAGRRPDFDRIGQRRRWGDRSLRDDDRYMFLEALLSAREKLYVSYVGQDAQANSRLPPSVVVQELLDTLTDSFVDLDGDRSIVEHPMQAFSPKYFRADTNGEPPTPTSYSMAAYEGARALVGTRSEPAPFITRPVAWSPDEAISLQDFVRFFENPTRAFLQKRLKLYLGRDLDILDTREPLDLDNLERWNLGDDMLRRMVAARACDFEALARYGSLPIGAIGEAVYERVLADVRRISSGADNERPELVEIDRQIGDLRIVGTIETVAGGDLVVRQYSKVGRRQELSLWIRHLFLCLHDPGRVITSRLYGRSDKGAAVVSFAGAVAAQQSLVALAGWYAGGQRAPLPLFDCASRAYAQAFGAEGESESSSSVAEKTAEARRAAEKAFTADYGDAQNEYVAQLYGAASPFSRDDELAERAGALAVAVYRQFLKVRQEEEL